MANQSTTQSATITSIHQDNPAFASAIVESILGDQVVINDRGLKLEAKVAFSCLVSPRQGDSVLFAKMENDQLVILAIVDRDGDQDAMIELPGKTTISSRESIHLASADSVSVSAGKVNLVANKMLQKADSATFSIKDTLAEGENLNASFSSVTLLSKLINIMAKQAIQKFKTYIRHSEAIDQVKAANMMRSSEGVYTVDSKQTVMISEKDTKIDAERIHIG